MFLHRKCHPIFVKRSGAAASEEFQVALSILRAVVVTRSEPSIRLSGYALQVTVLKPPSLASGSFLLNTEQF
jgi:hypothetical protein